MKQVPAIVGWLLLLIAFSLYVYGIYYAIFNADCSLEACKIPEPLDTLTSTIGAILLTNLGAVLGISVAQPQSGLAAKTLFVKQINIPPPLTKTEIIQYSAVILYLIVLIACFIKWATVGFSSDPLKVVPLISQNAKTLLGVISAYVAFVLGTK